MRQERGFAMLLVFVMAAAVAITLYRELPRVAFEAQRDKEQLLIERGEQYSRGIQLYVRKWKKYPATMEDLEQTNQIRFLRKRYIDPMTGKGDWRLVHVGPGGVFLDSLVNKPPSLNKDKDDQKAANTFTYEGPQTGQAVTPAQATPGFQPVRPSERAGMRLPGQFQTGQPVDPNNPQAQQPGYPPVGFAGYPNPNQQPGAYNPNQQPGAYNPNQQPGAYNPNQQAGVYNPNQQLGAYNPNQQYGGYPPGVPGVPGGAPVYPGQQPIVYPQPGQQPGAVYPGQQQPVNSQTGGVSPYPYSVQPGANGAPPPFGQPGSTAVQGAQPGQNQALNLINQILTTPRAGGLNAGTQSTTGGLAIGGGIAGVASTVERAGIKIYNEKEKYNEWEFLYDLTKDKTGTGAALGTAGAQQQQQQGAQQAPTTNSPFGTPPGAGNSPFGSLPGGFGQGQPQQPLGGPR